MSTLICLIRHGQTDWNQQFLIQGRFDIPLNNEGKKQINQTICRLNSYNIHWDLFLSSPLLRAKETCQIIKEHLGYQKEEIIIRDQLIEREFGEADGLKITDTVYERILNDDYQGMEKSTIIRKRAYDEMLALDHIYPNKKILIVTHSHFIKALFTQLDQKITFKSSLANGSLNFVEIDKGKIIHFKFNQ